MLPQPWCAGLSYKLCGHLSHVFRGQGRACDLNCKFIKLQSSQWIKFTRRSSLFLDTMKLAIRNKYIMSFLVGRSASAALASDSADAISQPRNVVLQTNKKPAANKASSAYSALLGAAMGGAAPSKPVRPVEEDDDEDVLPESAAPRVAQLTTPSDAWNATPPPPAIDLGSEPVPAFIAAVAFGGARPGFSFRAGESGVGYYRDPRSGPVQATAPPSPPPTLGLAELSLEEAEAAWVTSAEPLPPPPQPPPPGAVMTQPKPVVAPPAALVEAPPSTVPPPPPPPPTAAVALPSTIVAQVMPPVAPPSPPAPLATPSPLAPVAPPSPLAPLAPPASVVDTAATRAAASTSAGAARVVVPPSPAAPAAAAPAAAAPAPPLARPGAPASVEFGSMRAEREDSSSEDEDDEDDEDGSTPSADRPAGAAAPPARRASKDDSDGEVEFG